MIDSRKVQPETSLARFASAEVHRAKKPRNLQKPSQGSKAQNAASSENLSTDHALLGTSIRNINPNSEFRNNNNVKQANLQIHYSNSKKTE